MENHYICRNSKYNSNFLSFVLTVISKNLTIMIK